MTVPIRFAVVVLLLCLFCEVVCPVVLSHRRAAGAEPQEDIESIFLPAPPNLRQHLTRARTAIDERRYGDAVSQLVPC